jgi:predicted dehydrogenase
VGVPLKIGVIGLGNISGQYLDTFPRSPGLRLVAVADLDRSRAQNVATVLAVRELEVDDLLADDGIDAILNLTVPAAHVDIAVRALRAGKHVYGEKPLGLSTNEAAPMLRLAASRGLRVGSAPDTALGTGTQTARRVLDSGAIGDPVGAAAHWTAPGHELWHPSPQFYYGPGGGPLFDMGPYYLTSLVTLLGPVVCVSGIASRSDRERITATGPLAGESVTVDVDTHVSAILVHAGGATSTVTMSFEVWASRAPRIEVYGTLGTIAVPDPNEFSGPVEVYSATERAWRSVPDLAGYVGAGRGFGLADMARAIETGRPHRASGDLAFHVLEIMDAILRASRDRRVVDVVSTVSRPEPVPLGATPSTW